MVAPEIQEMIKHAAADKAAGRAWTCTCETCTKGRADGESEVLLEVHEGFLKVEQAEQRLADFRALRAKLEA